LTPDAEHAAASRTLDGSESVEWTQVDQMAAGRSRSQHRDPFALAR